MAKDGPETLRDQATRDADVFGTWRLVSMHVQVVGEATSGQEMFGPAPFGRAIFSPDHYAIGYIARSDRRPPTNDAEAAALLRDMIAYTGRFRVEGDRLITAVDGAWTEDWNGTEQVRFFRREGDTLTLATPEQRGPSGKLIIGTLVWRRET